MKIANIFKIAKNRLTSQWFVCRITSGKRSAQYGIRFSYPLFILIAAFGIFTANPYIVLLAVLVALFGIMLPMHPFDYLYNLIVTKLGRNNTIPGRGSELQVGSFMALLFNLGVIATIILKTQLNYEVMALIYVAISLFFIAVLLISEDFSVYSVYNLFSKRSK